MREARAHELELVSTGSLHPRSTSIELGPRATPREHLWGSVLWNGWHSSVKLATVSEARYRLSMCLVACVWRVQVEAPVVMVARRLWPNLTEIFLRVHRGPTAGRASGAPRRRGIAT